jgi:transposase
MVMVAEHVDVVIGADTHRDSHTLAVVCAGTGRLLGELSVSADPAGYRHALATAAGYGTHCVWAVEGTGSYGAGLTRHLQAAGEQVVEVERPTRHRGRRGKSDALDAARAARSVLAGGGSEPRGGPAAREAIRVLMVARCAEVETRAKAVTRIRALLIGAAAPLRTRLQPLGRRGLLERCSTLHPDVDGDPVDAATCEALSALAHLALTAGAHADRHERQIAGLVKQVAPDLLEEPGVGPISAAQLILAWSHPGRLHSEAAFARLAGAAPIPASSGQVTRHRLDRGGDRQLNRALHTILQSRRIHDPATRAYITRRTSEGKTNREAIRCLKRYLARHLYRLLEATPRTA